MPSRLYVMLSLRLTTVNSLLVSARSSSECVLRAGIDRLQGVLV